MKDGRWRFALTLAAVVATGCTSDRGHETHEPDAGRTDASDASSIVRRRVPPPISGGTLLATRDGRFAVASDPDTDHVVIVGASDDAPGCGDCAQAPQVLATIALAEGEEPGRLVEDATGHVHVVLRGGGAIATIDLETGTLLARRPVCAEPRGIAYEEGSDLLHVACASGDLVSLSSLTGKVSRRLSVDVDLRDVVVVPEGLVVSRFKTAELIRIDGAGQILARIAPTSIERGPVELSHPTNDTLEPSVAWRTIGTADGGIFMLHQYALARPLDLGTAGGAAPVSPYGAAPGAACGAIVEHTVSALAPDGTLAMGMPMPALALTVDVAASTDGAWLAVAHPGAAAQDRVTIYRSAKIPTLGRSPVRCASEAGRLLVSGQPVAVAMLPGRTPGAATDSDWVIVQTRAPAELAFFQNFASPRVTVSLGGRSARDPGHDLFHLDSGRGIACAQCHPEGGEDGRIWKFLPLGERRTQALHTGLRGTEPFHWSGNLPTIQHLVTEVFVRRMGGQQPSAFGVERLQSWLFSLRAPTPIVPEDDPAAGRGRSLFESPAAGCTGCHAGPRVAKNTNEDVGVDSPQLFQIPPLRGVGYRAPFLHNGCASTLRDRFDPSCGGGDRHGKTSQLSSAELDDLVSYLNSL